MSSMKRWLWELIENGDHQYLRSLGAPAWSIAEAQRFADAKNHTLSDKSIEHFEDKSGAGRYHTPDKSV